jgi:adenosine deaminase
VGDLSNRLRHGLPESTIKALPKVSLHDHLDGGLRPQTIVELAHEAGTSLPFYDGARLGAWIAEQANSGSLDAYLKPFDITVAVTQTRHSLVRAAREFVQDLANDGVIYGEVRWAPENHLDRGLSLDGAIEAVQEGIGGQRYQNPSNTGCDAPREAISGRG